MTTNTTGFKKYYPKTFNYLYKNKIVKYGLYDEECPVLNNGTNIGSCNCTEVCKHLNNSGIEKGKRWIICTELNEIKEKENK